MPFLLQRPPEDCMGSACTLPNGDRVYLRTTSPTHATQASVRDDNGVAGRGSLLSTPIAEMIKQENADAVARLAGESAADDSVQDSGYGTLPSPSRRRHAATGDTDCERSLNQLWVEKYRPTGFPQLLSDERINREVLRWIKAWDPLCQPRPRSGAGGANGGVHGRGEIGGGAMGGGRDGAGGG